MPVHSFWFRVRLVRANRRLFFLLQLAMFAATSGYSMSEKAPLLWERRILADREVKGNRLNTDCLLTCELQRHLESIVVMSRSQQQDGVI